MVKTVLNSSSYKQNTIENRYSVLCISGQNFAVEISQVKEVIPLSGFTRIPNVHECILGVFNLRGQIYPLIDIRILLKLPVKPLSPKDYIVLVEWESVNFGVVVDRVMDVLTIDSTQIQILTHDMATPFIHYATGLVEHKKAGRIYFLDLQAIVFTEEIRAYSYL
ncbi:MAG: chemotaxis protein CheW [Ignavibacteria bacterium]|nr:chemotaxis protein CheW [Ignavibacteria bacterium]